MIVILMISIVIYSAPDEFVIAQPNYLAFI